MKTKHTQGNWMVANSGGSVISHNGNKYQQICLLEKSPLAITPTTEANAKLIAAAPNLLQMVYDLMKCVKRLTKDELTQFDRDLEGEWISEAHELLHNINPDYYTNANTALMKGGANV